MFPVTQSLFVNRQVESTGQQSTVNKKIDSTNAQHQAKPKVVEGEFIKIGDSVSFTEAESLFERANQYAQLSNSAQNGLQAYTSIDAQNKREELRRLMGVDLYA